MEIRPFSYTRDAPLPSIICSPRCLLAAHVWLLLSGHPNPRDADSCFSPAGKKISEHPDMSLAVLWLQPHSCPVPGMGWGSRKPPLLLWGCCECPTVLCSSHSQWRCWRWEWCLLSFTSMADFGWNSRISHRIWAPGWLQPRIPAGSFTCR